MKIRGNLLLRSWNNSHSQSQILRKMDLNLHNRLEMEWEANPTQIIERKWAKNCSREERDQELIIMRIVRWGSCLMKIEPNNLLKWTHKLMQDTQIKERLLVWAELRMRHSCLMMILLIQRFPVKCRIPSVIVKNLRKSLPIIMFHIKIQIKRLPNLASNR
jgi:hypothetical protein